MMTTRPHRRLTLTQPTEETSPAEALEERVRALEQRAADLEQRLTPTAAVGRGVDRKPRPFPPYSLALGIPMLLAAGWVALRLAAAPPVRTAPSLPAAGPAPSMQPFRQTAAAADSVRDEAPLAPARDAAFDRQAGIIVRRLR